jgi:hypothetical protein
VNGTPTFYINGVRDDRSFGLHTLLAAIERAAAPDGETGRGTQREIAAEAL